MSKESRLGGRNTNQVRSLECLHKSLTTEFNCLEIFRLEPRELTRWTLTCCRLRSILTALMSLFDTHSLQWCIRLPLLGLHTCAGNLKSITGRTCSAAVNETMFLAFQTLITEIILSCAHDASAAHGPVNADMQFSYFDCFQTFPSVLIYYLDCSTPASAQIVRSHTCKQT